MKRTYSYPRIWNFLSDAKPVWHIYLKISNEKWMQSVVRYSHSLLLQPYLKHCLPLSSSQSTVFISFICCFYVPVSEWSYASYCVSLAVCIYLFAFSFSSLTHFIFIAFDTKMLQLINKNDARRKRIGREVRFSLCAVACLEKIQTLVICLMFICSMKQAINDCCIR